jgi:hypothetical protein
MINQARPLLSMLTGDTKEMFSLVYKSIRETGKLMKASPWEQLARPPLAQPNGPPQNLTQAQLQSLGPQSAVALSPAQNWNYNHMPATPLSAALGPAAQATIPSTPLTASGHNPHFANFDDRFRADSLLSMPTMTSMSRDGSQLGTPSGPREGYPTMTSSAYAPTSTMSSTSSRDPYSAAPTLTMSTMTSVNNSVRDGMTPSSATSSLRSPFAIMRRDPRTGGL